MSQISGEGYKLADFIRIDPHFSV